MQVAIGLTLLNIQFVVNWEIIMIKYNTSIFEIRYIDDLRVNQTKSITQLKGKPVKIEARNINDALQIATERARKKIGYSVASVERIT